LTCWVQYLEKIVLALIKIGVYLGLPHCPLLGDGTAITPQKESQSMRMLPKLCTFLTTTVLVALAATSAHAENFSLHTQAGAALNLTPPQSDIYTLGPAMEVKPMFKLFPVLEIGPALQAMYFPHQSDNGMNAGLLWQAGVAVRLQGRRDNFSGSSIAAMSPYVDVDLMAANTGNLFRPSFNAQLGLEAPTDAEHAAWIGVFLEYTHVFQTSTTQGDLNLNPNDPNIAQAGMSLSFDFPVQTKTIYQTHNVTNTITVNTPCEKTVCPIVPPPPPAVAPPAPKVELVEHIYFTWDSSIIHWTEGDKLNEISQKLAQYPKAIIKIHGHASVDGQLAHNVALSKDRADAVVDYLAEHGIDRSRMVADGLGVQFPAANASNDQEEGLERSRRVEFQVDFVVDQAK